MFFVDVLTAARLEMAQAWRATYYAKARLEQLPDPQSDVLTIGGAQVIYAGTTAPVNRAIGVGMVEPVSIPTLEAIEEFYAVRHAPVRLDVCPLADTGLLKLLAGRGYELERYSTILAVRLPVSANAAPQEVRISKVTPAEAQQWLTVVGQGFDEQELPKQTTLQILHPNFYATNAYAFFAWLGDEPAGGGGMYIHGGVAEFGGASTRPAYRKRGVQTALLQHRMDAAYTLGCDMAMVMTTPGTVSQRNVQRAGFDVAYTKATLTRPTA
jgi:GNAT superfamily N-acetyltransferase